MMEKGIISSGKMLVHPYCTITICSSQPTYVCYGGEGVAGKVAMC